MPQLAQGREALSAKGEVRVFCYVCRELASTERVPCRADKHSAHPECIGVLLQLTSARPQLLSRLSPTRQRWLLNACMSWIADGPHETILAAPQLMVQYAQLLSQLVAAWSTDMLVLEPSR